MTQIRLKRKYLVTTSSELSMKETCLLNLIELNMRVAVMILNIQQLAIKNIKLYSEYSLPLST